MMLQTINDTKGPMDAAAPQAGGRPTAQILPIDPTAGGFQRNGRALLDHGYHIVPIKPGHKAPAMANWQNARLGDVSNTCKLIQAAIEN
jgi:Bifunctional DNA primase/polymerase, N-terminal.